MIKHTELPWQVSEINACGIEEKDEGFSGDIAYTDTVPRLREEMEANAAFIVKACNNHDKLLESLKYFVRRFDESTDMEGCDELAAKQAIKDAS